jgi:NADH pyrophosphatase NudC (nudix superfamily)
LQPGESAEEALRRETEEELGLKNFSFRFLKKYIWESPRERELVYSFTGTSGNNPEIDNIEVSEGRFWKIQEIKSNLNSDLFTPNFVHEFNKILPLVLFV